MFSLNRFESLPGPMLVSLVNTQLRDHFPARAGFIYVEAQNQFKAQ